MPDLTLSLSKGLREAAGKWLALETALPPQFCYLLFTISVKTNPIPVPNFTGDTFVLDDENAGTMQNGNIYVDIVQHSI
jgi:hypothetical protein